MSPNYESALGQILSCQTKSDPDKWRKQAQSEEKPYTTTETLKTLVAIVEDTFELPEGTIKTRAKKYKDHSLSDIRAALVLHIVNRVKIPLATLAPIVGYENHTGVMQARQTAKRYLDAGDEQFGKYYAIIEGIAV
jgi:hypothetical protein